MQFLLDPFPGKKHRDHVFVKTIVIAELFKEFALFQKRSDNQIQTEHKIYDQSHQSEIARPDKQQSSRIPGVAYDTKDARVAKAGRAERVRLDSPSRIFARPRKDEKL